MNCYCNFKKECVNQKKKLTLLEVLVIRRVTKLQSLNFHFQSKRYGPINIFENLNIMFLWIILNNNYVSVDIC